MSDSVKKIRFEPVFWIVVGGLLFLGIAAFVELSAYFDKLILLQTLFRLDFRYWAPNLAYPLWLIFAFFAVDAVTFRYSIAETGKWGLRFASAVFSLKVCLVILIVSFFLNVGIFIRGYWIWWYLANFLLFALFLIGWSLIYRTKNQTDFTNETLNVRKRFLSMSCTITAEVGIFNFLHLTDRIQHLSTPLWNWFNYSFYSHWAGLAFLLICIVAGTTFFVTKEWLIAVLRERKTNRQKSQTAKEPKNDAAV